MKKLIFLVLIYILFSSHDMFLKLDTYQLNPNTESTLQLFNGTFERSDNVITRDRMQDASFIGNGNRIKIDTSSWSDINKTTVLNFTSGEAGTWIAGVSTKARNIEMDAEAFNNYLHHDGVLDMIDFREKNNKMDMAAIEKYSKHVKTIFQVGDNMTEDWRTVMGYPIEFVPLRNPYQSKIGEEFQVKLLWDGKPLANQIVYVGNEGTSHSHSEDEDHTHEAKQYRTNEQGIINLKLDISGQWYLRTIRLVETEESGLTHESNWATLTFEIPADPNKSDNMHVHADGTTHSHGPLSSSGMYKYLMIGAGILLILGLIVFLTKRNKS